MYVKIINTIFETALYKKNIKGFIEDCQTLFDEEISDDKLIRHYKVVKDHKVVKDCIHICKNLIRYKKYIEDIDNLSDSFIKSSKTHELIVFPFCNFDIKMIYTHVKIDEGISKYLLIFLNIKHLMKFMKLLQVQILIFLNFLILLFNPSNRQKK